MLSHERSKVDEISVHSVGRRMESRWSAVAVCSMCSKLANMNAINTQLGANTARMQKLVSL